MIAYVALVESRPSGIGMRHRKLSPIYTVQIDEETLTLVGVKAACERLFEETVVEVLASDQGVKVTEDNIANVKVFHVISERR